jgi:hypothetical protein
VCLSKQKELWGWGNSNEYELGVLEKDVKKIHPIKEINEALNTNKKKHVIENKHVPRDADESDPEASSSSSGSDTDSSSDSDSYSQEESKESRFDTLTDTVKPEEVSLKEKKPKQKTIKEALKQKVLLVKA